MYTNDHNLTLFSNRERFTNDDDCVIFLSGSEYNLFRDVIHFIRFQLILLSQLLLPPPSPPLSSPLYYYRKNNKFLIHLMFN